MAVSAPAPIVTTGTTGSGQGNTIVQPTTPFLQAMQDKAANQGKPGYDVLGNATATPPASEPTVLTSANKTDTTIPNNTATLANYPKAGATAGQDGYVRNADASFAEAPSDAIQTPEGAWTSGGLSYAIGPTGGKLTSDPFTQSIFDQFTQLKSQMDATGAANIENIKSQFENLIKNQQQTNAGQEAAVNALLLRGGSEHTASSAGIYSTQVSYGLNQIADLQQKENAAVIAAQQAQQTGDMTLLDKQLSIAQQASKDKQDAASKLNDTLLAARQKQRDQIDQAAKDNFTQSELSKGITDPAQILKDAQAAGNTTINAKDIADTIASLSPDQKEIHQMMIDAAKNHAPPDVLAKIGQSKNLGDAIAAAGQYTIAPTDPTSLLGQYQAAVTAGYKGLPGDWVAAQKYKEAYAAESAKQAFVNSTGNQSKLFQQGVQTLKSELSNRSGGLGLQDAKVNQAIHLKNLFEQYKTTKTVHDVGSAGQSLGTTHQETVYNIPPSAYTELAIGVASLVSNNNTVAEGTINSIKQATAKGDIGAALTYATGEPFTGSSQAVLKQLKDSVDRQGSTSEGLRQTYVNDLINRLPPDLNSQLTDRLVQSAGLNSYTNPTPSQMTPAQIDTDAYSKIQTWATSDPKNQAMLTELGQAFPNLSNTELAQKLKLIP